jgi:hypothetical protein
VHDSAWSKDLTVEVDGHGVVSHAGSAVLRLLADNNGLTGALSRALARRGFSPVHDRGRVLVDAAVCIADGGRVLSDLAVLRDQAELFGPVASDATLWRALEEIGDTQGADRRRPGAHPPPGVDADRGPARADPAVAGGRRRPGEDGGDPAGRHDPDRALGQTGRGGHVQGQLWSSPADRVV